MLFTERSLFVFLWCVSTPVTSTAEASLIILFSSNQCFTRRRSFSFFLVLPWFFFFKAACHLTAHFLLCEPLNDKRVVAEDRQGGCPDMVESLWPRSDIWMVEFSQIWWDNPQFFILTQFNLSDWLLRIRHHSCAWNQLIKQSYCDTCWKRGQSFHVGNFFFFFVHIAISKDKLFPPHLSRETNTSETDGSKPGAKENRCSPHGWIPPRVNAGDVLNIRARKKKAAISPSTSSPLICSSVCVLLPQPLASLSLEAGGKGKEQRLSSHERNNFIQTPLCVNTQLQHISV